MKIPQSYLCLILCALLEAQAEFLPEPPSALARSIWTDAISSLTDRARRRDPSLRGQSIIGLLPKDTSREVMPFLLEALFDEDVVVRFGACSVFDRFLENHESLFTASSPATRAVLPALRRTLKDHRPELRMWAATAAGQIGPAIMESEPTIREALEDERDHSIRFELEQALNSLTAKVATQAEKH